MWSGVFLPEVWPAVGGGENVDVELPQSVKELRVTAYNATAARGAVSIYFLVMGVAYLLDAHVPTSALDCLVVYHAARVARDAKVRVTFAGTVAADELHVHISYDLEEP